MTLLQNNDEIEGRGMLFIKAYLLGLIEPMFQDEKGITI
jgi:hypothetical protein